MDKIEYPDKVGEYKYYRSIKNTCCISGVSLRESGGYARGGDELRAGTVYSLSALLASGKIDNLADTGYNPEVLKILQEAGIGTLAQIKAMGIKAVSKIKGIDEKKAGDLFSYFGLGGDHGN